MLHFTVPVPHLVPENPAAQVSSHTHTQTLSGKWNISRLLNVFVRCLLTCSTCLCSALFLNVCQLHVDLLYLISRTPCAHIEVAETEGEVPAPQRAQNTDSGAFVAHSASLFLHNDSTATFWLVPGASPCCLSILSS